MRNVICSAASLLVVAMCCGFSVNIPEQADLTASIKRGQTVYTQYCLACHQANGSGVPGLNPPLIKTKWVLGDKTELITVVLKGLEGEIEIDGETYRNTMPAHSFLTDQQVADVLTFVRNSFGNKAGGIASKEVKEVRGKIR